MKKELLEKSVARRLTTRQIANENNCSQSTIKYWLAKYGLKTVWKQGRSCSDQLSNTHCKLCKRPLLEKYLKKNLSRCDPCSQKLRRAKIRKSIIHYMGGKCSHCGWTGPHCGFDLHHIDPLKKDFTLSGVNNRAWTQIKEEAHKCILLCAICHRIEHSIREEHFEDHLLEYGDDENYKW